MHLATLHEEHFLKADLAAQRLEQVLEIDPNNEEAYFKLERNYRKLRQWLDLINTYDRHIAATLDRKTKVDLYGAIAQVYADEVEDADRAIDAYKNIVDLDDQNVPALEALAKLYDKLDDAAQSIDYMTRVAELTQDTKQRVESFYRIGKALDEKLGDRVSAQERYEMALDLDPSHLPTLAALRQIAIDAADYDKAARYLDQEQSYTTSPRQRARLLVELGKLRDEMLGDHPSAVLAWEAAYEADGENEDAAMPLVDEYIAQQEWAKAEPLLDLLVRKSGKRERGEQHALQNKLGQVCAALDKDDKALKAYTAAHQLDLTDQVTIRGLAEVCFRLKDWGAALTNYQKVLTALGEDETAARADVYYKLGCIKREQGQAKQAINNFEKALSVDPAYAPTLEALVSLYTELKDWKQVVAYKRQILDNVFEGDERFRMLNEIADVWSDQDKSAAHAPSRRSRRRASCRPLNPGLLHKLIALYQATENWSKMIDTLQAIADSEKDAVRKRKFLYTMAQLYRDKEGDQDRAVELFGEALDLNPQYLEAFERINKILTAEEGLEGARARVPQDAPPHVDGERVEPGPRVQPLAQPRSHLPRSPEGHGERHRGLQDGDAVQARRGRRAADPRGALRGDRSDRGRRRRALARPPEGPAPRRPVPQPLQALSAGARVRPRLVHVRRARVPAQDRRRGAALLRGLPAQGHDPGQEPPRQRGLGEEPLPQGREPLHRQDLRDAHARGDRREDQPAQGAEAAARPRPAVPAGPGDEHGDLRQDVRVGGAGPRRPDSRSSTSATTCRARSWRSPRRRRRAWRARRCSRGSRRRSSRSSSASTSRGTAASTTSRTCSRRSTSSRSSCSPGSRSS